MPVTSCAGLVLAAVALLVMSAPLLVRAASRERVEIVRSASQLAKEKSVRYYEDVYAALASARVVYHYCAKDLAVPQENLDFLKTKLDSTGRDYLKAFEDAYRARTGVASPASLSQDYANYLAGVQKQSMENTLSVIQNKRQGCFETRIRDMVKYVDKLRQLSKLPPEEQAAAASSVIAPPAMVAAPPKTSTATAPAAAQQ